MAWLNCEPKGINKPRFETCDAQLPELFEHECLHELFDELGRISQGFNGAVSISWSDLLAWNQISGYGCTSWDLLAIKKMSQAYASMVGLSSKQDYIAPYTEEEPDEEEQAKQSISVLEKYVKNG